MTTPQDFELVPEAERPIDIADIVYDREQNVQGRVDGFHRLVATPTHLYFKLCLPQDRRCRVVTTTGVCSHFHHPWHLVRRGVVAWAPEAIAESRECYRKDVDRDRDYLLRSHYPQLLDRFASLSAHERLALLAFVDRQRAGLGFEDHTLLA